MARKHAAQSVKNPKRSLVRISDITCSGFQLLQPTKYLSKTFDVFAAMDLKLLDPSTTKTVLYSAVREYSAQSVRVFRKSFEHSRYHTIRPVFPQGAAAQMRSTTRQFAQCYLIFAHFQQSKLNRPYGIDIAYHF